jgi:hypothetical protein
MSDSLLTAFYALPAKKIQRLLNAFNFGTEQSCATIRFYIIELFILWWISKVSCT